LAEMLKRERERERERERNTEPCNHASLKQPQLVVQKNLAQSVVIIR